MAEEERPQTHARVHASTRILRRTLTLSSGAIKLLQRNAASRTMILFALYDWLLWGFVLLLVLAQLLGIVWDSTETRTHVVYGQSPLLGPYAISGTNDEPYSDRLVVCVLRGRLYKPAQLSKVLRESTTHIDNSTLDASASGYRVVTRESALELDAAAYEHYTTMCDSIAATLDAILDSCAALGYNVTRDYLRIVDGVESAQVLALPNALPVLIMPFWDNAIHAHESVPGWDGSACVFRLTGKYETAAYSIASLTGTDRSIREPKTVEWLRRPGGVWRHGWYEDPSGMKWYAGVRTTDASTQFGIVTRHFDALANRERNCTTARAECASLAVVDRWGTKLSVSDTQADVTSIAVSNGSRFGLFLYEASPVQVVRSVYDLETFISNASVVLLLCRWMLVMLVLQTSYWRRKCANWENAGIGCLATSRAFLFLPLALLPRLRNTLTVFFSLGCNFEGNQKAFTEAWFVMYPGIVELVLLYFSLLNLLARALRRRMTDALFGPTLLFFCAMHKLRVELAQSGWFEFDGRVSTVFTTHEYVHLRLVDFFTTGVALRINGNVTSMLAIKVAVLALNLVPLAILSVRTSASAAARRGVAQCRVESVLALRVSKSSGLGGSAAYETLKVANRSDKTVHAVSNYELVRLGYMVMGDRYLITIGDWYYFLLFAAMRTSAEPSNYRVVLVEVKSRADGYEIVQPPRHFRLNDPELAQLHFWQLSAVSFK